MANHLWQSTIFGVLAALLALVLRNHQARVRHWLWMTASLKFLVPFSLLTDLGSRVGARILPATVAPQLSVAIETVSRPFASPAATATVSANHASVLPAVLLVAWLWGLAALAWIWCIRWRRVRAAVRDARPLREGREWNALWRIERIAGIRRPTALVASEASMEPGVFGILRPVLMLPADIMNRLDDDQLDAILAHELCHVQRRDNLAAAIHMFVQAVFWFHPLVWWLGARLVEERERACDEEVLRLGSQPEIYAGSILKICQWSLESPLACVAGVTGSDLKKRVERIMTNGIACQLSRGRKLLLAAAGIAVLAAPIAIGILTAPRVRAQSKEPTAGRPQFEVASIKPTKPGTHAFEFRPTGYGLTGVNVSARLFIRWAYGIQDFQLSGGPDWLDSETWDIVAKAAPGTLDDHRQSKLTQMLQSLLAERFKLAIHRETRELPVFALVAGKNEPKLHAASGPDAENGFRRGRGMIRGTGVTLAELAEMLSGELKRTVLDRTGIGGKFDFTLEYTPERIEPSINANEKTADPNGPSIFTAIQEQLGLKLESSKGPVQILVIDHVEKPTEN